MSKDESMRRNDVKMTMVELKEGDSVTLVHYHGCNKVSIMPVLKNGELIHLADDIKLCQLKQGPMTAPPTDGDIILVKYRMNGLAPEYYRAVVIRSLSADKLIVRMLDAGEQLPVDISDCKHADEAVRKHPIYARHFVLDEIPADEPNLMMSRVSKYLSSIVKEKLTVRLIWKRRQKTFLAQLIRGQGKGSVNEGILATGTWFWEKSFNRGNVSDHAISKDLEGGLKPVYFHEIPTQKVVLNEEITVKIEKFANADMAVVLPQIPKYLHDFPIFERQIQNYTKQVSGSPYFPEPNEVVLMRIFDDPSGIWKRASRNMSRDGNWLYSLDYGDMCPLEFCEVRRIPIEFTLVGTFAVYAQIKMFPMEGISDEDLATALRKVFAKETSHRVKATAIDESTAVITFSCVNLYEKILHAIFGGGEELNIDAFI